MSINRFEFTTRLLIDAGVQQGMRILDVGCGSGDVSFLLCDLIDCLKYLSENGDQ